MKRFSILITAALACAMLAGSVQAADEAAQKRKEKMQERQKALSLQGILKLESPVWSGDPSQRLDIVILGDGYTKDNMDKFQGTSDRIIKNILNMAPFDNFANYVNVHRLYLESPAGEYALKSEVTGDGEWKMLNCDREKAESLADLAPDCDIVFVLSNIPKYGRANASGKVVLQRAASGATVTVHEFGHAFAGLADEYTYDEPRMREGVDPPVAEPSQVNVTLEPKPLLSKWHYWAELPATLPFRFYPPNPQHRVNNPEGAMYVNKGVYRSERSCAMRYGTNLFCSVCLEQMIRSFLKKINPIETQMPSRCNLVACKGEKMELGVRALDYEDTSTKTRIRIDWRWYQDGKAVEPKQTRPDVSMFTFDADAAGTGVHSVVVSGDVNDQRVRRDNGLLGDARFWQIEVLPYPRPVLTAPAKKEAKPGETLTFVVKMQNAEAGTFTVKTDGMPKDATFKDGTFTWTPAPTDAGAFLVDFIIANDKLAERARTLIVVQKAGANQAPKVTGVEDESGYEGQSFDFTIAGDDPERANLIYNISFKEAGKDAPAPDGLAVDRRTGNVTWTPGFTQAGTYRAICEASDGVNTGTSKILFTVMNARIPADGIDKLSAKTPDTNFDFCLLFRSEDPFGRQSACGLLKDMPVPFGTVQLARLLRDNDDGVRGEALKQIEALAAGKDRDEFAGVFFREVAGKAAQFTDFDDIRAFLKKTGDASKDLKLTTMLKSCIGNIMTTLKKIDAYNVYRDQLRKQEDAQREKDAAKEDKRGKRKSD